MNDLKDTIMNPTCFDCNEKRPDEENGTYKFVSFRMSYIGSALVYICELCRIISYYKFDYVNEVSRYVVSCRANYQNKEEKKDIHI